jgi:serine/threonine-protein phosphatase 2B regulatory subunit
MQLLCQEHLALMECMSAVLLQTYDEADLAGDGVISLEEWRTLVCNSPDVIGYMTLPVLKEVTVLYPSFIFNPRRKYERSFRGGDRSFSSSAPASGRLQAGLHSFDAIPKQRSIQV